MNTFLLYLVVKSILKQLKLESCAIIGNPRLVNEVSENNLQLTGDLRMQTSNKSKSRVVILSDSHLKGYTKRINNYLSDKLEHLVGSNQEC
jgi:hypothetical protein